MQLRQSNLKLTCAYIFVTCADTEGERGSGPLPQENHKWLCVSLEFLVRIHFEKHLDPSGPIAFRGGPYGPQ